MGATPDQLKADIRRTRAELTSDVDTLADKVNPAHIVRRRTEAVRSGVTSMKERVMGTVSESVDEATAQVTSRASSAKETAVQTAHSAPAVTREQAQGNPLAAGLIAFGAGLLAATVIPSSRTEQQLAEQVKDKASDLAEPVAEVAKESAQEVAEHLKPAAKEAVEQVRGTSVEAAGTTTDHARAAAQDVADTAKRTATEVKQDAVEEAQTTTRAMQQGL